MVTMLLAAINYSLQLGYLLTFLLFALALVSMPCTYRNLASVVLRPGRAEPVHEPLAEPRGLRTPGWCARHCCHPTRWRTA